jgi:hypothetical protein
MQHDRESFDQEISMTTRLFSLILVSISFATAAGASRQEMLVSDFFRPATVKEKAFEVDRAGKPVSFLLGAWFQDSGRDRDDRRMKSEIHGATAVDGDRPGDVVGDEVLTNCYRGAAADVRLYDAALPPEAIRKLAGKSR